MPGFIATDSGVGMFEVDQELVTHDGVSVGDASLNVDASDGIVMVM